MNLNQRKAGKMLQWDYDEIFNYSEEECCFALTAREVQVLMAITDFIGWRTRWLSLIGTEINQDEIDTLKAGLETKLMQANCGNAVTVLTRQNPNNFCQMQQSYDGGETWQTIFDYSLCSGAAGTELYIIQQQFVKQQNALRMERYDGSPTSIDPDAPTTTWNYGGATGGTAALCNAIQAYVEQQMLNYYNLLLLGIGAAAIGAGALGWLTGGLALILGGVVVLVVGLTIAGVQGAINDREAMDAVICRLKDDMIGGAVSEGDFWVAIDGLTWDTANEHIIVDVLRSGMYKTENYLFFLALIGEAKREVAAGIDNCPCDDEWCYLFSFGTSGDGGWVRSSTDGFNNGTYVIASGWTMSDFVNTVQNPDTGNRAAYIRRDLSPRTITKIVVTYDFTAGTYDSNTWRALFISLNGAEVLGVPRSTIVSGTNLTRTWTGSVANANRIELFLRSSRDISAPYTYNGGGRWLTVEITGRGSNPFGADNCME